MRARRPSRFERARRADAEYARRLRAIARHVDELIRGAVPGPGGEWDPALLRQVEDILAGYADILTPWAEAAANRMLAEVARKNANAFFAHGQEIGWNLRREIATTPLQSVFAAMRDEQVRLIKSLPLEAAERVHKLSVEGLSSGTRWENIAKEIRDTGPVTRSRANTIARTEVGRASTTMTQARSEQIGSPGYWWRTARDADVRPRHRELEGQFILWSQPPVVTEPGQAEVRAHAGAWVNCRCWPEPVIGEAPEPGTVNRRARNPAYLAALRERGYTTGAAFEE